MFTFPVTLFSGSIADLAFLQAEATQTGALGTTVTFAAANIGAAAADRYVVVTIHGSVSLASRSLSGVTIGGNAATIHANANANIGGGSPASRIAAIAGLLVPSGTTANIVATFSDTVTWCQCRVYTLRQAVSNTPTATQTTTNTAGATALNNSINIPTNGALLVAGLSGPTTGSFTQTGVNEDSDINVGNICGWTGHQDTLAAESPRAYSQTISSATSESAMAAAAWQ